MSLVSILKFLYICPDCIKLPRMIKNTLKTLFTAVCAVMLSTATPAHTKASGQEPLPHAGQYHYINPDFDRTQYDEQIRQVEEYLSNFTSISARFTQSTPGHTGYISNGKIYISRPGKARWEYNSPIPSLLIVNDGRLTYYDKEVEQVSYAEVPDTPLQVLLHREVRLSGSIKVADLTETASSLTIVLANAEKDDEFEALTLVFDKDPMKLRRIHRTNENNTTTVLTLIEPKFDKKLDESLFIFKDPRPFGKEKN